MAPTQPTPWVPLTYREYCQIPEDGMRHELVEGEFHVTPAPTTTHQTVSRRLQTALIKQLEEQGLAYVFNAPTDVLLTDTTVVQPDLIVVRAEHKHLIEERGIVGAPDLLVEILSDSNRSYDELYKRSLFARLKVPEYWIVDPKNGFLTAYREPKGDLYSLVSRFDRARTLVSPGFPEISIPLQPVFAPL